MTALQDIFSAHITAADDFLKDHGQTLEFLARRMAKCFQAGNKILFCGNGGSACDAMHIAGEFVGRFMHDRPALPAIALSADAGILTAVGNDYGFEQVFSRQVEALGNKGDILVGLSTSGSSPNVVRALDVAQQRGLYTVLFTGEKGKASMNADMVLAVRSTATARIQEVHIVALHALAALVEPLLFSAHG